MVGTNVLKTQLQTGNFEMISLGAAIKDTGAINVTLEENEDGDDDSGETVEMKDANRQGVKYRSKTCDQGTQTELLLLFTITDIAVHGSIEEANL